MTKQLAQLNIARAKGLIDDPVMKEFADFLLPVNQLAEESPGFVWRLKDESGTSAVEVVLPFDDPLILVNMSVWESLDALENFAYKTVHSYFVRNGKKWFERLDRPHFIMWWVEAGHEPTVEEALAKLLLFEERGAHDAVFDLANFHQVDGTKGRRND